MGIKQKSLSHRPGNLREHLKFRAQELEESPSFLIFPEIDRAFLYPPRKILACDAYTENQERNARKAWGVAQ